MAYSPTAKGTYEVSTDGGTTWLRVFNVTGYTQSGGDREETTTDTLDEGTDVSVGDARPKDLSITVNAAPATAGARALLKAYKDGDAVQIRKTTSHRQLFDNSVGANTVEVAADGTVTGVNTRFQSPPFGKGRGLTVDGTDFVIESVTSDTSLTVSRPDGEAISAISASDDWQVVRYGVKTTQECEVLNAGNPDLSPGSPYADTFTLKTTGVAADPEFVFA